MAGLCAMQVYCAPMSSPASHRPAIRLSIDIAVIGAGVAGLWIANRLQRAGYQVAVFEQHSLGNGQSIASQGMIHGGVKYTLSGALTGASEAIADMPDYWRLCLAGKGDVDLSRTRTLSDHFYMWSTESSLSKITAFFASKALRGRVDALDRQQFPEVFRSPQFRGNLYQLVDSVIDTPSLLQNLADNLHGRVFTIDWNSMRLVRHGDLVHLELQQDGQQLRLDAQQFIFAAGEGNATLLQQAGAIAPAMQRRPLQQVMVKHHHPYRLYAHCIGADSTPRLTISSHPCADGSMCWYLGGQLAERGVNTPPHTLAQEARQELQRLFPWLSWQDAQWATLAVNRAEPLQKNFARPDNAFIDRALLDKDTALANVLVAWPTKLTLSPHLGDQALALLQKLRITPEANESTAELASLPPPAVATAPWDKALWMTLP